MSEGKLEDNQFRLVSRNCVNSNLDASWLQRNMLLYCRCGFTCKVKVEIKRDGYDEKIYVLSRREYNKLKKELKEIF